MQLVLSALSFVGEQFSVIYSQCLVQPCKIVIEIYQCIIHFKDTESLLTEGDK